LSEGAKSARNTEDHGVVLELLQAIMIENATRGSVDVGVGVLGLAVLLQDVRCNLESL
jgi:hypothetical protein